MKIHRLGTVLTIVNLFLLLLVSVQPALTATQTATPVIRARAIELVNERARFGRN